MGTYVEQGFQASLRKEYDFSSGSSACGIDFPELNVDLKVTSITQPQSSCPFDSASQKVYGLGYHLLVFVYDKIDDSNLSTSQLKIQNGIFIDKERTGDYQTTKGIREILDRGGNKDDLIAFFQDRMLPLDEIGLNRLSDRVKNNPPKLGYLTISNALQWRLQYSRPIEFAKKGSKPGVVSVIE